MADSPPPPASQGEPGGEGPDTTSGRDVELERLRMEVEVLRSQQSGDSPPRPRRSIPWRGTSRWTLLVVAGLMAILSVLMIWVRDVLLDTNTWVSTMAPVAASPAVQSAIANDVTNQLFEKADVQTKVKEALPPSASFLSQPLTSQLRGFSVTAAKKVVASDQFQTLWVTINRHGHAALVAVLTGQQKGRVSTSGGKVTLDLSSVTTRVQNQLEGSGISALQGVSLGNGQVVLFSSPTLQKAQGAVNVLQALAFLFPVLALACLAGATALSRDRRRGLLVAAISLSVAMLVLLGLLAVVRSIYLGEVVSPRLPGDAASAIFNAVVQFVRQGALVVFGVGAVVALGAALAGPSRAAVTIRRTVRGGVDSLSESTSARGWDFGPVGGWVERNRSALLMATLVVAAVVLVAWSHPTLWVVVGLAIIVVVLLGLIELLGRASPAGGSDEPQQRAGQDDAVHAQPSAGKGNGPSTETRPVSRE